MSWVLLAATIIGFALTAIGLLQGVASAKAESVKAEYRVRETQRLLSIETTEQAAARAALPATAPDEDIDFTRILSGDPIVVANSQQRFALAGLVRPSLENLELLALLESQRYLQDVWKSTKSDLLLAGLGVVVSTIASAVSLFY